MRALLSQLTVNSKVRTGLSHLMWTHFVDFSSCVMSRSWFDACPILDKVIESQEGVTELVLEKIGPRESLYMTN